MKIIDLSNTIESDMPLYPGDIAPGIEPFSSIEENGAAIVKLTLGTHTGTHVDAPNHILKNGEAVHKIPLVNFTGEHGSLTFHTRRRNWISGGRPQR